MVTAWFAIFPVADWSFDLLAMVNAAIALFATYQIARLYLSGDKALLVPLFLLLMPFYQFQAQRFGANQPLLSTWPIATYCFLRAFNTRSLAWSAAAGFVAGLGMLGKYYSIYLIGAFVLAALSHPARWTYLRSPSPWVSALVGLVVLGPHLNWLTSAAFTPFDYAAIRRGGALLGEQIASVGGYLLGSIGYVALPLAVYALIVRPDRRLLAQTLWPADPDRRLLVVLLAAQLTLPALSAPFLGVVLTSLWSMEAWFLLPIVLLAPDAAVVNRPQAVSVAATVLVITAAALLAAPIIAWASHIYGTKHGEAFYRLASEAVTREWHTHNGPPLTIVMGDRSEAVAFYSPDHPDAVPGFALEVAPWVTPARLAHEGYAVICAQNECAQAARARTANVPNVIRRDVELRRSYLGHLGPVAQFAIFIVPPERTSEAGPR